MDAVSSIEKLSNIDLVVSTFGSFSYINTPLEALRRISNILTPNNGHLLLMVYSRFSAGNISSTCKTGDPSYINPYRPYNYRNDAESIESAPAHFYLASELVGIARMAGFSQVHVCGLNAFIDHNTDIRKLSVESAKSALLTEMRELQYPDLGHSLILTATNYE